MDRELLAQQLCELPVVQYEFFETAELVFSDRVRYICRTECPQYGKSTLDTRASHEEITHQVAALVQAQGAETYALSTESCAVCPACTYPNAPCRRPDRMFPCVESHGILVTDIAERYGIDFQSGGNIVTWFSLILYR